MGRGAERALERIKPVVMSLKESLPGANDVLSDFELVIPLPCFEFFPFVEAASPVDQFVPARPLWLV